MNFELRRRADISVDNQIETFKILLLISFVTERLQKYIGLNTRIEGEVFLASSAHNCDLALGK